MVDGVRYIRSSDADESRSAINQPEIIRAFAERRGFQIMTAYQDCSRPGNTIGGRPAFGGLLHKVKRLFALICHDKSR